MKVITLINEKGGVGKTTLAVHLAAGMAAIGKRVVLIDTDPQGHATIGLGFDKRPGVYDLLVRGAGWQEVLMAVSPEIISKDAVSGMLAVVGSNIESRYIAEVVQDSMLLSRRLNELRQAVDVVVIDTNPTVSSLHGHILLASDYVLLPTVPEFYALQGIMDTMDHIEAIGKGKREAGMMQGLDVLGIVPVMYKGHTNIHKVCLDNLKDVYGGLVWEPIADRTNWPAAALVGDMVWMYEAGHPAAIEAEGFVKRAVNEVQVRA